MEYTALLSELQGLADEKYREFHFRLLGQPNANLLGVRMPVMRKLAKKYRDEFAEILQFPAQSSPTDRRLTAEKQEVLP